MEKREDDKQNDREGENEGGYRQDGNREDAMKREVLINGARIQTLFSANRISRLSILIMDFSILALIESIICDEN